MNFSNICCDWVIICHSPKVSTKSTRSWKACQWNWGRLCLQPFWIWALFSLQDLTNERNCAACMLLWKNLSCLGNVLKIWNDVALNNVPLKEKIQEASGNNFYTIRNSRSYAEIKGKYFESDLWKLESCSLIMQTFSSSPTYRLLMVIFAFNINLWPVIEKNNFNSI